MFQLEQAIKDWKADFSSDGTMTPEAVDELECHLRDSIEILSGSAKLSEEEAFLVAQNRLGIPQKIGNEFAKVNQRQVWLKRAILFISGYLLISLFMKLIALDHLLAGFIAVRLDSPVSGIVLQLAAGLIGVTVLLWVLVYIARGPDDEKSPFPGFFNSAETGNFKAGTLFVIWLIIFAAVCLAEPLLTRFLHYQFNSSEEFGRYYLSGKICQIITGIVSFVALGVMAMLMAKQYRKLKFGS